jgi:phosphoadenosine phosphosulfate reductase
LYWLKPQWHDLTVYFCNSGDAYPETLAVIDRVKKEVPFFVEVQGDSQGTQKVHGWPSDIVPSKEMFPFDVYPTETRLNSRELCCLKSLMLPMHERMLQDGITKVYRGQRLEDRVKGATNGTKEKYQVFFPIETWTTVDVTTFLKSLEIPIPAYYETADSAPDCLHCTAWLEHNSFPYLKAHYPQIAAVVQKRIVKIHELLSPSLKFMEEVKNG